MTNPSPTINPSASKTNVHVIGAGPVGLTLAYELARHGVPGVRLVEKRAGRSANSNALIVHVRTQEAFDMMGTHAAFAAVGYWRRATPQRLLAGLRDRLSTAHAPLFAAKKRAKLTTPNASLAPSERVWANWCAGRTLSPRMSNAISKPSILSPPATIFAFNSGQRPVNHYPHDGRWSEQ